MKWNILLIAYRIQAESGGSGERNRLGDRGLFSNSVSEIKSWQVERPNLSKFSKVEQAIQLEMLLDHQHEQ